MLFFFDLYDNDKIECDEYGDDVAIDDIVTMANSLVAEYARARLSDGGQREFACEVRNEAGSVIYRAEMSFRASSPVRIWMARASAEAQRRSSAAG